MANQSSFNVNTNIAVGDAIRRLRTRAGLDQAALAHLLGYASGAQISRIESGARSANRNQILRISSILDASPSESDALLILAGLQPQESTAELLGRLIIETIETRREVTALQQLLRSASDFAPTSLEDFLHGATVVWIAGSTLYSYPTRFQSLLEDLVNSRVAIRAIVTHPALTARHPVIRAIESRRGPNHRRTVRQELTATLRLFARMLEFASPAQLQVFGSRAIPSFGITIADPLQPTARARVSLHFQGYSLLVNPTIDFNVMSPGQGAYVHAAVRHFETLADESERLLPKG